jgi:hypothetical protein
MMALGCLQSQKCHTNECPVGIATQDKYRQRGLVVEEKYQRVANFHRHTLNSLFELVAAAGLSSPQELELEHFQRRDPNGDILRLITSLKLDDSALLDDDVPGPWQIAWKRANPASFRPLI